MEADGAAPEEGTAAPHGGAAPLPPPSWPAAHVDFPVQPQTPPGRGSRTATAFFVVAGFLAAAGLAAAALSIADALTPTATPQPPPAAQLHDEAGRAVWRTAPVDKIFPPTLDRTGGERYIRLGVAPAAGCGAVPAAFVTALQTAAPGTSCVDVLRATYIDSTQTVLATVGVVVVDGTADARDKVWRNWTPDGNAKRPELMPGAAAVPGTPAAAFTDASRITWSSQASNDGRYLVYAVTAFADGRIGSTPDQLRDGSGKELAGDSPPVQAARDLPDDFVSGLEALQKNGSGS